MARSFDSVNGFSLLLSPVAPAPSVLDVAPAVESATVGSVASSVASLPVKSTRVVVSPALTMILEVCVVVPVVNADALSELVVPVILGKDVVEAALDDEVLDVVTPEVVTLVVALELVV